jgi:predicted DNA-binding mobile mystery protein A
MDSKKLQIEQLEKRIKLFLEAQKHPRPPIGWIKTTRLAFGMTLQQLGAKLSITRQSAHELESREKEGSITLKALSEAAKALDMELVYGLVPIDGTLEKYIEKKAHQMAEEIVYRTSASMKLEDQGVSYERIQKAIEERAKIIKHELPKSLWD